MKRILFISNYQKGVGGISAQVDLLQHHLQQDGYVADIFSTKGNPIQRVVAFFRLLRIASQYDVLHVHGCSDWGMLPVVYATIACRVANVKCNAYAMENGKCPRLVVTYHGGEAEAYFKRHGAFAKRWLCRADKVIVLSGFLKKVFDQYEIPCEVIPNIVTLRPELYVQRETIQPKFISIRHLRELYNIPCILRAFERVQKEIPEASLDILGQGDQRSMLEEYVREHGLQHVQFVGQVPNTEIYDYLNKNDILLSAPRIDNMPVSLLEAMNAGLVVISSRVGGVPYMIREGYRGEDTGYWILGTGLLFESDNDEELAEKMLWAVRHPEECIAMTKAAHEGVKKYSWENVKSLLENIYQGQ